MSCDHGPVIERRIPYLDGAQTKGGGRWDIYRLHLLVRIRCCRFGPMGLTLFSRFLMPPSSLIRVCSATSRAVFPPSTSFTVAAPPSGSLPERTCSARRLGMFPD